MRKKILGLLIIAAMMGAFTLPTATASTNASSLTVYLGILPQFVNLNGIQARSEPSNFNLSLGVPVSGELTGANLEDWYYLGHLDFAAYNFLLTTNSSLANFQIVLKAWCPKCPGQASMIDVTIINNFGMGANESGIFVPPSLHLKYMAEFIVKVEDLSKIGGQYTLLVEKVGDATSINPNQPVAFYDFGPGSHLLFSFHPSSGGLFNMSISWSDPTTTLSINGMSLTSTLAYQSSGGSTWARFYLEDSDWMDLHISHVSGVATNTGNFIIRPVDLEILPRGGRVSGSLDASDPSSTVRCYVAGIPPGLYYDLGLDVSGSLDASLSVHGNVYVSKTTLWNIGSSSSGGVGESESILDLVAWQGLSFAMGESGSKFQFTTPQNGTMVDTRHVIVVVKAESGSGQFNLTLSIKAMPQLEEGIAKNASFDLLNGRRYAFWSFTGSSHVLYVANVSYTIHRIADYAYANVYGTFIGVLSDFSGGFSSLNVSNAAVESFREMYTASQGYTNFLTVSSIYGNPTSGFQVCTPFFSGGVKLFGFAFMGITNESGLATVDTANASVTLTSHMPTIVNVGDQYKGSIVGSGLVGDLVAVELYGGSCYNLTLRCYGVNPIAYIRSGSGEYLTILSTMIDYNKQPASMSFVVFSGEGGVNYVHVVSMQGEGEYVLTITPLSSSEGNPLPYYALALLSLQNLDLQGTTVKMQMVAASLAIAIGLLTFAVIAFRKKLF